MCRRRWRRGRRSPFLQIFYSLHSSFIFLTFFPLLFFSSCLFPSLSLLSSPLSRSSCNYLTFTVFLTRLNSITATYGASSPASLHVVLFLPPYPATVQWSSVIQQMRGKTEVLPPFLSLVADIGDNSVGQIKAWELTLSLTLVLHVKRALGAYFHEGLSSSIQLRITELGLSPSRAFISVWHSEAAPWDDWFAVVMQKQVNINSIVFVMLLRTLRKGPSRFLEKCRVCLHCVFGDWVREWVQNLSCLTHPAVGVGCLQCSRVSLSSLHLHSGELLCL